MIAYSNMGHGMVPLRKPLLCLYSSIVVQVYADGTSRLYISAKIWDFLQYGLRSGMGH